MEMGLQFQVLLKQSKSIVGHLLRKTFFPLTKATNKDSTYNRSHMHVLELCFRLQNSDISLRFCSNESTSQPKHLVAKLERLGFQLSIDQVFTPLPATVQLLKKRGLRPHLLVHNDALPEFENVDTTNPNCVVLGDAQTKFSYANMNEAFSVLMGLEHPILITMGYGKYYMETDGLKMDVGAFCKALEYSCDIKAEIVGKPAPSYFQAAADSMNLSFEEIAMIGDDIVSDVGGAQKAGITALQVRTGKWRASWENHPEVKPDLIVDNLSEAVQKILQ